jgi:hypothetical protein
MVQQEMEGSGDPETLQRVSRGLFFFYFQDQGTDRGGKGMGSGQEETVFFHIVKEGMDEPSADVRFPGEKGGVHENPDEPGPFFADEVVVENSREHDEHVPFMEDHPGFIDLERKIALQYVETFRLLVVMTKGAAAGGMGSGFFRYVEIPCRAAGKGRNPRQGNGGIFHGENSFM